MPDAAGAHAYAYDSLDRLIAATHTAQPAESYTYDGVGNRTASHLTTSYSYQPTNRLISAGPTSYSYDLNGNLISKADGAGTWAYAWDYENRLAQVTRPDGQIVNYKYDALGRRIERSKVGAWTRFSYDGDDVVLDAASGGGTVEYLNGLEIDDKLSLRTNGGSALYFVSDHLGSTRALVDSGGSVVEATDYDSFGRGSGSVLTRYSYTGREYDPDTGLYYYRARWYDPQAGRFISEDPIEFEGGVNWYAYVENDPVGYIDPYGLDKFKLPSSPGPGGANLPPGWRQDKGHKNPNGERWLSPDGKEGLDFDRGQPGKPGNRGDDGWHKLEPDPKRPGKLKKSKEGPRGGHYKPGDEVELDSYKKLCPARPYPPGPLMEELRLREEASRYKERFWQTILDGALTILTRRLPTAGPLPSRAPAPVLRPVPVP